MRKDHLQVTFRQLLTMLAIFDISFIVCASISFSLPQLSSHWRVSRREHFDKGQAPFGHNPIALNIDGKLAIANCNALAEQVLNICKCCLRCHSLFSCCWDCQVLLFHLSNTRPECIRLGLSTCRRRLRVFNPKYVYQYERVKQAVN